MVTIIVRHHEELAERAFESTAVAEAGFHVHAPHRCKAFPDTTGWVSFRVDCPKVMTEREVVQAFSLLCS